CGCEFCFSCAEMSPLRGNIVLKENEQMGKDDKPIQESLTNHEEELRNANKNKGKRRHEFDLKANLDTKRKSSMSKARNKDS
ncbi:hypothetical protein E2562_021441, partial [Oryza meyeriana var. granulata]